MTPPRWAVYRYLTNLSCWGWVMDTCAGGVYSNDVDEAKWWSSPDEAANELRACDMLDPWRDPAAAGFHVVRVK